MAKKNKDFDYFDEFQKQAKVCVEASSLLVEAVDNWTTSEGLLPTMEKMHQLENAGDAINHAVFQQCARDFVTPIEREDLLSMSQHLDTVIDLIEEVLVSFYMLGARELAPGAKEFTQIINQSCVALEKAMKDFRDFKKSKKFRERIMAVNDCEEEGDRLYLKVMHDLYTAEGDNPMRVVVWTRVFDNMEKCCDACEHVADAMDTVLLRNS